METQALVQAEGVEDHHYQQKVVTVIWKPSFLIFFGPYKQTVALRFQWKQYYYKKLICKVETSTTAVLSSIWVQRKELSKKHRYVILLSVVITLQSTTVTRMRYYWCWKEHNPAVNNTAHRTKSGDNTECYLSLNLGFCSAPRQISLTIGALADSTIRLPTDPPVLAGTSPVMSAVVNMLLLGSILTPCLTQGDTSCQA